MTENPKSNITKQGSFIGNLISMITPAKPKGRRSPVSESEIRDWFMHKIADVSEISIDSVDPDTPFADFGLDSRTAVSMAGELERKLGRDLSPTLIWDFPTINEVSRHICSTQAADSDKE